VSAMLLAKAGTWRSCSCCCCRTMAVK
jgi:hypothetical protein